MTLNEIKEVARQMTTKEKMAAMDRALEHSLLVEYIIRNDFPTDASGSLDAMEDLIKEYSERSEAWKNKYQEKENE